MSRRCLDAMLTKRLDGATGNLVEKIAKVKKGGLSSLLGEHLDAVREIGNYAAHPRKSYATGEILQVEPEEAEFTLRTVRLLMDHWYVQEKNEDEQVRQLREKLDGSSRAS